MKRLLQTRSEGERRVEVVPGPGARRFSSAARTPRTTRMPIPAAEIAAEVQETILPAQQRLQAWIEAEGFRGWDPYDALNSSLLRGLSCGNRLLGIAFVQLLRRCPFNLRPLLGIAKDFNPKAMGLLLAAYLRCYLSDGNPEHIARLAHVAGWLQDHVAPGYSGACWGYNFDWPNRAFYAPAGTPTAVNSAFIGLAFVDLHRHLGAQLDRFPALSGVAPLNVARSVCEFLLRDLRIARWPSGDLCFSYTPLDDRLVHNANMLAAWLLASVYSETAEEELARAAMAAAHFTVQRQAADGFWPYGTAAADQWIDNFHTGFVLSALKGIAAGVGTGEFQGAIRRGYEFWKGRMFLADGTPKYYANRTYPVDVHAVAQAVLTFLDFGDEDPEARSAALRVAAWGIRNLQDKAGFFHYQLHRGYRIRIPYMRWAQAWMFRSLSELTFRVTADDVNH